VLKEIPPVSETSLQGTKRMKIYAFAAIAVLSLASLAGCSSTGTLTPAAQATMDQYFTLVCSGAGVVPALAPAANDADAGVQAGYNAIAALCANGEPNNLITAGLDIASIELVLQKYHVLSKAQAKHFGAMLRANRKA
jgi:hypothetical protein